MKKIIWILLLLVTSCTTSEIEYIHDKSPEERIEAIKSEYSDILASSEFGWKVYFGPVNTVGKWIILMDFDGKGSVKMKCDPISSTLGLIDESGDVTYRLDFSQSPELVIESYSQFSAWDEVVQEGETQFIIEKYENDKLYLKSKSDLGLDKPEAEISYFIFEKATQADWDISEIGKVMNAIIGNSAGSFVYDGNALKSVIIFNPYTRMLNLYSGIEAVHDSEYKPKSMPFCILNSGIALLEPIVLEGAGEVLNFNVDVNTGAISSASDSKLTISDDAITRIDISGDYTFKAIDVDPTMLTNPVASPVGSIIKISRDPTNQDKYIIKNASFVDASGTTVQLTIKDDIYIEGNALSQFTIPINEINLGDFSESKGDAILWNTNATIESYSTEPIIITIDKDGNLICRHSFVARRAADFKYILKHPEFIKVK